MKRVLAGTVLVLGLVGCGTPPPVVNWRAEAVSVDFPEPYQHLYLREVSLSECADICTSVPMGERYVLDRESTRTAVHDALAGLGIFKQVDVLGSANEAPSDEGLVLDLSLDQAALVHTGETGSTAFWLWLLCGYPGLCVHDQLYSVYYEARARVSDAKTGDTLVAWEPLRGPEGEYALNFNERTTGFAPYVAVWVVPPTSLGIDEVEVARKILPPSLRPTVQSLVRLFNQITFAPVNKVEVLIRPAMGIRVDDVSAPVQGGVADVTIHATLAPNVAISWAACGDVRVDLSKEFISQLEKPIEIVLPQVPVVPGEKIDVEVGIAGQDQPQKLVTLTSTASGELRPEGPSQAKAPPKPKAQHTHKAD
jgi:hypothetical protein